jgi:ATP-binding cassette subfamily B multidrug efflux pump
LKALLRLIPFVHPYRYKVLAGFIAFFIARLFEASSFLLVAEGIDAIDLLGRTGEVRNWRSVGVIAMAIVLMVAGRFLVVIYARIVLRRIGIAVSFDLRQKLYTSVQRQGSQFFGRISVGDIMTRAIQDISLIQRLLSFGLILLIIMVYAPVIAVAVMLYKSAILTLFILPGLPIIFIYCWYMAKQLAVTSLAVQQRLSDLSSHTQENLSGIRTVQAMVQEDNEIARFLNTNNAYADAFYDQARINSLMVAWMPLFAQVCQLAILVIGGKQVMDGQITIGGLFVFFYFLNMLLQPIRMAGFMVTLVQRAAVAVDRLYEIFDAEPEITDCPSGETPGTIRGEFELRHLTYTYPGTDKAVLKDISLTIKAGESFAIVGRVGCGKSTLLKQFTRLVDTAPSQLYLDGYDVRDYPLSQLRIQIAQVLQDPFLFGEPLRNNISYDNPDREVEHIWDSADAAAMRGTIEDFPQQLDTLVGERGVTLSGGQKQRTALARGLIRDEPVLILDDCFSSVDTETEEHILRRLKEMRKHKTTILVSHRVSTLRHSDRILVLEDGGVAELGTHQELVALDGIYAELERLQTQGYNDNSGRNEELELDPV